MDKEEMVMQYYSAIKKNEILSLAMMWLELEGIMLREISQSEKDKYHVISLICGFEETNQPKKKKEKKQTLKYGEPSGCSWRGGG